MAVCGVGEILYRFNIVYTTDMSGARPLMLKDRNIYNNLSKLKKADTTSVLNKGDSIIYVDPTNKSRMNWTGKIKKLNFKAPTKAGVYKFTQTPKGKVAMGTKIYIPPEKAASYNIQVKDPVSKKKVNIKNVKRIHLIDPDSSYRVYRKGWCGPMGTLATPPPPIASQTNTALTKAQRTKIDNFVRKFVKSLLPAGTKFHPDEVYDPAIKMIRAAGEKEVYKIKNKIIVINNDKNLFTLTRFKMLVNPVIFAQINVQLFLSKSKDETGESIPSYTAAGMKTGINRSCKYHLDSIKNLSKRLRGGKRKTRRKRRIRRKQTHRRRYKRRKTRRKIGKGCVQSTGGRACCSIVAKKKQGDVVLTIQGKPLPTTGKQNNAKTEAAERKGPSFSLAYNENNLCTRIGKDGEWKHCDDTSDLAASVAGWLNANREAGWALSIPNSYQEYVNALAYIHYILKESHYNGSCRPSS